MYANLTPSYIDANNITYILTITVLTYSSKHNQHDLTQFKAQSPTYLPFVDVSLLFMWLDFPLQIFFLHKQPLKLSNVFNFFEKLG